jgi:hypothetical protein
MKPVTEFRGYGETSFGIRQPNQIGTPAEAVTRGDTTPRAVEYVA